MYNHWIIWILNTWNMIELLTRGRLPRSRTMISFSKWTFWSYKNMTNNIITIPIFFKNDDSGVHLREFNVMETNIGTLSSGHFVELHHEMLNWDLDEICEMCWYIVLMVFGYFKIWSSERIFVRHYFRSNHWELQYCSNYECLNCFQKWLNSIVDSSSSTVIKCLIDGIDIVLYKRDFRYRVP